MPDQEQYAAAVQYINSLTFRAKKHSIPGVQKFLDRVGAPDLAVPHILHVAGTNGKGSTSCYLSSVLTRSGYRVGLFTSPHLVTMRERMQVQGELITKEDFASVFAVVRAALGDEEPSYFEFLFLMAMVWFAREKVDVAVLETGMGGLHDATNAVRHKDLSLITRIGMDHMQYLGNTLEEIAAQKAGIIRENTPVVCLADPPAAWRVITRTARERKAPCWAVQPGDYEGELAGEGVDFSYRSSYDGSALFPAEFHAALPTAALYEAENAALACRALEVLWHTAPDVWQVNPEGLTEGLRTAITARILPGRMQEVWPHFYADGAHNEDAVRALAATAAARRDRDGQEAGLVFSCVRDKAYERELSFVAHCGVFRRILVCPMPAAETAGRGASFADLRRAAGEAAAQAGTCRFLVFRNAADAVREARCLAAEGMDMYAAGSLYFAGMLIEQRREEND